MTFDDDGLVLELARDWKAGRLTAVHPSIGRRLNAVLVRAREDPVPFARATDPEARSLVDLVRAEHERARSAANDALADANAPMRARS